MQKQMEIKPISLVFLSLLFLLFFNNWSTFHVHANSSNSNNAAGLRFKLIHRHSPELGDQSDGTTGVGTPNSQRERVKQLLHSDRARQRAISHKLSSRRKNEELKMLDHESVVEAEFPMRSGAIDLGSGQYFVSVRVGSPPRKFLLMADTGSTLTWMKCKYKCEQNCSNGDEELKGRIYYPNNSRSFRPIPCSSALCNNSDLSSFISPPEYCHQPTIPCKYDYRYGGKSNVLGIYGNDTVKFRLHNGQKIKMTDVIVGCTERILEAGGDFEYTDGVLGLGFNLNSFAVITAMMFGHKFSYCLVDHMSRTNVVNFLHFGQVKNPPTINMQYTDLDFLTMQPYYLLTVTGISIDGKMLDIPPHVWDVNSGCGMMLDSGSSLTYLLKPAYDPVISVLEPFIRKFKKIDIKEGLEYCFDTTIGFTETSFPQLAIHFAGGAKFSPPVKSYIIDYEPGVNCIGFISTASHDAGMNIMGNIMQQNHLWEFDLLNSKLGFAPSTCVID